MIPPPAWKPAGSNFADKHVVDRIVNTGIAWHEGQLFGWANQLMGLLTAIALAATAIMGVLMWLKRRPEGRAGGPTGRTGSLAARHRPRGIVMGPCCCRCSAPRCC